jgi:hypothetical protein
MAAPVPKFMDIPVYIALEESASSIIWPEEVDTRFLAIALEESAASIIWPEEVVTRFLAIKLNINITFLNSTFT